MQLPLKIRFLERLFSLYSPIKHCGRQITNLRNSSATPQRISCLTISYCGILRAENSCQSLHIAILRRQSTFNAAVFGKICYLLHEKLRIMCGISIERLLEICSSRVVSENLFDFFVNARIKQLYR